MGKLTAEGCSLHPGMEMREVATDMKGSIVEMSLTGREQSRMTPSLIHLRHILTPISWSDGSKFVGAFQRGAQTGPGELTTLKGDVVKGSWLNGRATGSMTLTMAGGDVFEGQFENGILLVPANASFLMSVTTVCRRRARKRQLRICLR